MHLNVEAGLVSDVSRLLAFVTAFISYREVALVWLPHSTRSFFVTE